MIEVQELIQSRGSMLKTVETVFNFKVGKCHNFNQPIGNICIPTKVGEFVACTCNDSQASSYIYHVVAHREQFEMMRVDTNLGLKNYFDFEEPNLLEIEVDLKTNHCTSGDKVESYDDVTGFC
jgi:hypothetical protein